MQLIKNHSVIYKLNLIAFVLHCDEWEPLSSFECNIIEIFDIFIVDKPFNRPSLVIDL